WILALGASLLGAACGGGVDEAATGSSSGAGGEASSSSSAATTATGAGGDGQGGQGTSSATTGTGTGGAAPEGITPGLESAALFLNCQPIVPPDPINGSFTAKYKNSGTLPMSATITSAKLVFGSAPKTLSWPFTVSPGSGGPVQPGTTLSVQHMKQPAGGGAPEGSPCDFCNSTVSLTVTWDLGGGKTATDTLPAEKVSCAF
ncbi:MAG: hypothetical protein ACMG6S_21405, partial [Byssovorax sp.]